MTASLRFLPVLALLSLPAVSCAPPDPEVAGWEARAARVEIVRDEWGVPHIYGPTDADAVFGLMYAQAEDDFPRIEKNFLFSQGRQAEAEGEDAIFRDLRMRLFIDPDEMQAMYAESPAWLQDLMDAWADGLNYYLHTHPEVEPQVLDRFEPWMALTFSEGSIGGDIERVSVSRLEEFYGDPERSLQPGAMDAAASATPVAGPRSSDSRLAVDSPRRPETSRPSPEEPGPRRNGSGLRGGAPVPVHDDAGDTFSRWESGLVTLDPDLEPRGSNGIAVAPEHTATGNAMLLINPHTSFFFRHEAHVVSDEGLNAYGALTWGQFFVYQGFNETAGWMHTSSTVDNIDEFAEEIVERGDSLFYRFGEALRPVETRSVSVAYRTEDGGMAERDFQVYRTHHGPVVRAQGDRWISVALMEEPMRGLIQSYSRTKAANLEEYLAVMEAHTNSSNNTLFADAEGNVAYLHSNFVPVRDTRFDYSRPVDGSDPATDWQGVHDIDQSPNSINPASGWAFCSNNWPYSAAGSSSPSPEDFPAYMDRGSENPRGIHALDLLDRIDDPGADTLTLEGLNALAYDPYLPAFASAVPRLVADLDALPAADPRREELGEAIEVLRGWDYRWSVESIATSLAVFWGTELRGAMMEVTPGRRLDALAAALARLETDFGDWRTPWGEINRFQRLTGDIDLFFDDQAPSTPVGFTSARWGSLASFGAGPRDGTVRWYGTSGNSFVAVVEFGERVRALAVTAGGLSNDPASPHFNDQADRYATGDLRSVHFYRDDVEAHAERTYRPGR